MYQIYIFLYIVLQKNLFWNKIHALHEFANQMKKMQQMKCAKMMKNQAFTCYCAHI